MISRPEEPLIVIGICTRQRNALLRRLLESIWAQPVPARHKIEIIVVDNNDLPSVTQETIALPPKFQLTVSHEPKAGLVHARNRLLDMATASDADWLIGVDDDERVAANWLESYITAFETLDAPIIVAAKRIIYPSSTSPFVMRIQQEQLPEGAPTKVFSTANFAIHQRVFHSHKGLGLRFDPALNESGGEDFELMLRAKHQHGITAVNWPHAVAFETFDGKREEFSYHFRRNLWDQVTRYRILAAHRRLGVRGTVFGNAAKLLKLTNRFLVFGTGHCLKGFVLFAAGDKNAGKFIGIGLVKLARAIAIFPFLAGKTAAIYGNKANADRSG